MRSASAGREGKRRGGAWSSSAATPLLAAAFILPPPPLLLLPAGLRLAGGEIAAKGLKDAYALYPRWMQEVGGALLSASQRRAAFGVVVGQ